LTLSGSKPEAKPKGDAEKLKAEIEPGGLAAFARGGRGVGESELVELMQLPPEELLVRQHGLVFGDERG
jgi:hypothetical protein